MQNKCGLLLVNLGSPDAPNPGAVRKYLGEFLHDQRVIDTSRWIWCPILHGIILRTRPARSAKLYAKIWGDLNEEAPLIRITRDIASGVQAQLPNNVVVDIAMRYGNPSIAAAIDNLMAQGCRKISILPLYPQYAGATTASVFDGVAKAIKTRRDVPEIRLLRNYHTNPAYISALASSIDEHLSNLDFEPDIILASYHGLPQKYVDLGDPYQSECIETTDLLREKLGFDEFKLRTTFQSRFGPMIWLQPYTDKMLEALPLEGFRKVAVVTPGFAADCLETLEEISMEGRGSFIDAGGTHFSYIPCLNDRADHISMFANLAKEQLLAGWLDS